MRKNYSWISGLALVTVVSSFVLLMFPLGSVASQGDWAIRHNWEWVLNHGTCHVLASDGVNNIYGSFEWNTSSLNFYYTYNTSENWEYAPSSYQNGYYLFDFYTQWDKAYGEKLIIRSFTLGSQYDYWCWLPL